jgi:hypothetical protein
MKKVFSVQKFIEDCKRSGYDWEDVEFSLEGWATDCDGLTRKEMFELGGYVSNDDWEIEVEE